MQQSPRPAVSVRQVSKWYGTNNVLKPTSLDIMEGEFVSLLGPSGSGKSTLLRMIAGFVPVSEGIIYLRGKDATHVPPPQRNTAMVFQNYALFPHKTVADNLAFGLRMRKLPRGEISTRVDRALSMIHLDGYGTRYPKQLSGGEQQRVALMRALITEPDVLLMDEPLGALDRKLREELQLEIKALVSRMKATTIYVTHDQEEALVMSDRIAVMQHGQIDQIDTPPVIYSKPLTPFVANFVGVSNILRGTSSLDAMHRPVVTLDDGLTVRCGPGVPPGEQVTLVIRPELIVMQPVDAPAASPNSFTGEVTQRRFLGLTVQYVVRLRHGAELLATQLDTGQDEPLINPGAAVRVEFSPDVVRVLVMPHGDAVEAAAAAVG